MVRSGSFHIKCVFIKIQMNLLSGNHAGENDSFPRYRLTDMRNFLDFVESLAVPQDILRDHIAILLVKRYDINFPFHVIASLRKNRTSVLV